MNTLARLVRFVVWVLVLSWVIRMVGRLAAWALRRAADTETQTSDAAGTENGGARAESSERQLGARQLVRDPVCGMHLAESLAIPYRDGGELMHFCSTECREQYARGILRRAANG